MAVQRQPAAAAAAGAGRLRIVSLNAEAAGRGPAFEMDLAELVSGGRQSNSKHAVAAVLAGGRALLHPLHLLVCAWRMVCGSSLAHLPTSPALSACPCR